MPQVSSHRLFHAKTLRNALSSFPFPVDLSERHQQLLPWIRTLASGTLDEVKETSLHGDFLKDVFQSVLGYRSVIAGEGQNWELHAEQTIADGGGSADGALGFFTAAEGKRGAVKLQGRVVAPIELKGARNDLDRAVAGRKESAVDQGWRYANRTMDCRWVLVSNYREIRLYQTSKTPAYYEVFRLKELEDLEAFKTFYFVLCRQNFLPDEKDAKGRSAIDRLLIDSDKAEVEITKKLYEEYKQVRLNLAKHFRHIGPKDLPDRDITLIEKAQKTLDRILFVAFCEDKHLLPRETLRQAHDHKDPCNPRPIWQNFKAVFRAVDEGNDALSIPGYNGGLFRHDPLLDEELTVSDVLCTQLNQLARYDFDSDVSVNILGHVFEQSVTDLEELRSRSAGEAYNQKKGKRKTQGVYYTPAFITQYIVGVALGGYLERKEKALWQEMGIDQIRPNAVRQRRKAEKQFWERYRGEVLQKTRVIDPACGSGAFLIAAFDFLNRQYERVNEQLAALALADESGQYVGQRSLFDLNKTILNQNLYGVDLSPESVEITKLSLWLKTAERGKQLTYLDDNIQVGNSIIADPNIDPRAFDWQAAFPEVFADGGFDVVIGNPPYVRQELLSPFKPYLQEHYAAYDGVADLYVYFYEKGLNILRPNGILSYIVTNKWLRAGYGEPLRQFFAENSVFEQIIDFGHAPIFEDADVFPCIVSVRKPLTGQSRSQRSNAPSSGGEVAAIEVETVRVCLVQREHLGNINLPQYVSQEGHKIPWELFNQDVWSLEPIAVKELIRKIGDTGIPLREFSDNIPYRGILTGLNAAFLLDNETKDKIIQEHGSAEKIIYPYLAGRDIKRWFPEYRNLWIILIKSSSNHTWPWTESINIDEAENIFKTHYPSIWKHFQPHRQKLIKRWDKGVYWWELRSCAYYQVFEEEKIMWQDLGFHSRFCLCPSGLIGEVTCFSFPSKDLWILAVLNSPLMWSWLWRNTIHGKDEVLRLKNLYTENIPIAPLNDEIRAEVEPAVQQLIEFTQANQSATREVLEWLQIEHGIEKPGNKLSDFASLPLEDFLKEVKKRRPKGAGNLGPRDLKTLKEAYGDYALPIQTRRAEGLTLEHRVSDLVNQAYGLTPEEIDLMWKTAPPRMPFPRPS